MSNAAYHQVAFLISGIMTLHLLPGGLQPSAYDMWAGATMGLHCRRANIRKPSRSSRRARRKMAPTCFIVHPFHVMLTSTTIPGHAWMQHDPIILPKRLRSPSDPFAGSLETLSISLSCARPTCPQSAADRMHGCSEHSTQLCSCLL